MKIELKALRAPVDEDKLPSQAEVVMSVLLETAGVDTLIDKEALILALENNEMSEEATKKLNTRQDPNRILSFYIPKLEALGLIEKIKTAEAKPVATAEGAEVVEKKARKPRKAKVTASEDASAGHSEAVAA